KYNASPDYFNAPLEIVSALGHRPLMNRLQASDETRHPGEARKALEPCSIVIFGASGDLTARKLIPAFYHLYKEKQMPSDFRIIGFARREKTDAAWRQELRQALAQFSRTKPVDDQVWQDFSRDVSYCLGDITDAAAYD